VSSRLRAIAAETVAIVERGGYRDVVVDATRAVSGTRLYLPDEALPSEALRSEARPGERLPAAAMVEVTGESTLAAARRLGGDVAALNFASARSPGGGFLNGAQAQEESLARASALYHCLRAAPEFYAYHRSHRELTYTDRVIYSPRVPVFRDDRGRLLDAAYPVSFLTAAAPNRAMIVLNQPEHLAAVPGILRRRAGRVLQVAAAHGHRRLVLGAWGCGVFGNDPAEVADAFAGALADGPWFEHVTFAVLDKEAAFRRLATT
jgi:uncharacterized protein (TIGR02452 family)